MSSRRKPNQLRSRATVDAISEACLQVLVREGPRRLTTNRIAERAGVSVGTLYQYFTDKEDVLQHVLLQHVERLATTVADRLTEQRADHLWDAIPPIVDALLEAYAEAPETYSALVQLVPSEGPLALVDDQERALEQLIEYRLVREELATEAEAGTRAAVLVRAVVGVIRETVRRDPLRLQEPALRTELTRLIRGIVWGHGARPVADDSAG